MHFSVTSYFLQSTLFIRIASKLASYMALGIREILPEGSPAPDASR